MQKPKHYYEIFLILGNIQVLPPDFAKYMAPIAGFRNILVHDYIGLDWDLVYQHLLKLEDFYEFEKHIKEWIKSEKA